MKLLNAGVVQKPLLSYKSGLPRIVYYHLVSNSCHIPYYYKKNVFTERILNEQLTWYKKNGYTFITLDEAVWLVENNEKATKTIAFTTDDGFQENYSVMAPVFSRFNIKPTLFLLSNCLDNNDLMWNNKIYLIQNKISKEKEAALCRELAQQYHLPPDQKSIIALSNYFPMAAKEAITNRAWELAGMPPLKQYLAEIQPYLTNKQVSELLGLGYSLGSHSMSHPEFSKLTDTEAKIEMLGSKKILAETFNTEVRYFSYPYGKRVPNKAVESEILQAGAYKILLGTKSNLTNNLRNKIWERDKMEQEQVKSQFWFTAIPVFRNTVLRPLGLYL
ncbi:polysaccharide deacetylase family protein [Adhaeribacter sp. BT258]|uniref:Polysaccharide deacetylase family protein n=1 Tax=Adhaeribacter terrigena TaxID=2793070 RepID=A0ABS1C080_9BACT|nr:polysaccharide deacetylase family protein [Adhaeribacter terrigena]MBK0401915.1 polysaccharide deacetylase family protein [Adhaeribacter terrigena]